MAEYATQKSVASPVEKSREIRLEAEGVSLPHFVREEFEAYLKCGRVEYGFLRVKCDACRQEKLVAFSCKRRGFCPSCGARRMAETAAHLVEHVLPEQPIRQWVLSFASPRRQGDAAVSHRSLGTYAPFRIRSSAGAKRSTAPVDTRSMLTCTWEMPSVRYALSFSAISAGSPTTGSRGL